ncbi:hypothetical protein [Burkholderia gladioli]|uniref:hypothetical protein n=1 Tax=Burkholderia gladioli TaxID=28095 RepID=UPI0034DB3BF7
MKHDLCIRCRHYGENLPPPPGPNGRPGIRQPGAGRMCMHPSTSDGASPVDGSPMRYMRDATAHGQRSYPHWIAVLTGRCGSRARFFERGSAK